MLLEGPRSDIPVPKHKKPSQPSKTSKESKEELPKPRRPLQQPKVLEPKAALLLGHHHVPQVASPQLHITHIPDKLMPFYMNPHEHPTAMNKRIDNTKAKDEERKRQQEMFEMMKIHQRLLYTIIATIGIPVVLMILFYIEVL